LFCCQFFLLVNNFALMELPKIVPLMIALAFAGCKSSPKGPEAKAAPRITAQTNEPGMPGGKPVVRPVDGVSGRVISVKDDLRFVIIDFPNQKLPRLDQRLAVYRAGQKVAEVKVSGPIRGTSIAADITAGDPQFGDQVRDER
jgi:hypothetical protein